MMSLHYTGFSNTTAGTDNFGFKKPEDFNESSNDEFLKEYLQILARRSKRWETVTEGADGTLPSGTSTRKLKRFIRKGVPSSLRKKIWFSSSGAETEMNAHPGEFELMCQMTPPKSAAYAIDLDLDRTFPDNENFRGVMAEANKNQLKQILSCFAVKHPEIGYCQGLNYIAALLLLVFESTEHAFWMMDVTIGKLPEYYHDDMKGLKIDMLVLRELIKRRDSEVETVLHKFDVDLILFTSKWYLCWYLETLPMETVFRVWDCLFYEGPKILFRVAMTLILRNRQRMLNCTTFAGLADLFRIITVEPSTVDCHKFMEEIFDVPGTLSGSEIAKLRTYFATTLKH